MVQRFARISWVSWWRCTEGQTEDLSMARTSPPNSIAFFSLLIILSIVYGHSWVHCKWEMNWALIRNSFVFQQLTSKFEVSIFFGLLMLLFFRLILLFCFNYFLIFFHFYFDFFFQGKDGKASVTQELGWSLSTIFAPLGAFVARCKELASVCDAMLQLGRMKTGRAGHLAEFPGRIGPSLRRTVLELERSFLVALKLLEKTKGKVLVVQSSGPWQNSYAKWEFFDRSTPSDTQ